MKINSGLLFARHKDGFVELWVMSEDGVRPAKPSDFMAHRRDVRENGDLRFADASTEAETSSAAATKEADALEPLSIAAHLQREATRLAADVKVANEACVLAGLTAAGKRCGGLSGVLITALTGKN